MFRRGNGSIALTVDGVNRSESNSSISESLLSLLEVSVEANASEGFEFRRWVGLPNSSQLYSGTESSLLSTNATISFSPSTDLNISAEFALIEYDDSQVVISESSHGSVILETEANGNFLHFGQYNSVPPQVLDMFLSIGREILSWFESTMPNCFETKETTSSLLMTSITHRRPTIKTLVSTKSCYKIDETAPFQEQLSALVHSMGQFRFP